MKKLAAAALGGAALMVCGCAAGPQGPFDAAHPAGFWAGLWHGFIAWITFVVSLFSQVKMYAASNTGWPYDLGFLIGMGLWLGGGAGGACGKAKKSRREREWEEVAAKVEAKVKREMRQWAEAEPEEEWQEVERKLEEKVKRKIKEWADS